VISCARGRDGERIEKQGTSRDEAVPEQARPDSVTAYVDLVEMGYAALEPIPLRLIVRNEAGRTLHLTFPTAQRFDFIITKDREPVWSWGQGRMFAQALGRVALAPGDSAVYEYTWDGRLPGGSLPRLGRYTVKGVLMTMPPVETEAREFGIVD
jgi:hypothetical protein